METNAGEWTNYEATFYADYDSFIWNPVSIPLETPTKSFETDECLRNELKQFIDLSRQSGPDPIGAGSNPARPNDCVVQQNYSDSGSREEVNDVNMESTDLSHLESQSVHQPTNRLCFATEPNTQYAHSCVSHMKNNRNFLKSSGKGGKICVSLRLAQTPEEGGKYFIAMNLVDDNGRLSLNQLISRSSVEKKEYWNYKPLQVVMEQAGSDPTQLTCSLDRLHIYHTPEHQEYQTVRNKYIEEYKFACNGGGDLSDDQRLLVKNLFLKDYPNFLDLRIHKNAAKLSIQAYLKRADDTYYPVTDIIHSNLMKAKSK